MQAQWETSCLSNEITFVSDGGLLLQHLDAKRNEDLPGLILLDLLTSGENGHQILGTIKSNRKYREIPVVVLTSPSEEKDTFQSFVEGADARLDKPVTTASLIDLVRNLNSLNLAIVGS